MKKKIGIIALILFLFSSTVYAASINGDYEGDSIIKVYSGGNELTISDVPAILHNSRTLVPLYLMRQIGVDVTWDGNKKSVNVTLPKDTSNDKLKVIAQIADLYHKLTEQAYVSYVFSDQLFLLDERVSSGKNVNLDNINNQITGEVNSYNDILAINKNVTLAASEAGFQISGDTNKILKNFYDIIDSKKRQYDYWNSYLQNKNTDTYAKILDEEKIVGTLLNQSLTNSIKGYELYIKMINN